MQVVYRQLAPLGGPPVPTIQTRAQWGARPPRSVRRIPTPTKELWLHHTAGAQDAGGNGFFGDDLRAVQRFHMDTKGWSDIAYSFLADHKGGAYEGRGAGVAGGHTAGRNTVSHAICAIGNYEIHRPTPQLLETIAWMVAHGLLAGWWSTAITGPHKAAPGAATACCGKFLIAEIPAINQRAGDIVRDVVALAQAPAPAPLPSPVVFAPEFVPPHQLPHIVSALAAPTGGAWLLGADGGVFAYAGAEFHGSPVGKPYWGNRRARRLIPHAGRYVIEATSGETYGWDGF